MPHIAHIAVLVRDYDEALAFYCDVLGFVLIEDTDQPLEGKRWVSIAPPGAPDGTTTLLLARANTPAQVAGIGRQAPDRVFLFLATDNFARDHAACRARGVRFLEAPRIEPYGTVAVFEDLYGNRWDLIEPVA